MASDKNLKVGIVGCGVVATAYYLPGLMQIPNAEVVTGIDWGLHNLEMMAGAIESSESGKRYEMTTRVDW